MPHHYIVCYLNQGSMDFFYKKPDSKEYHVGLRIKRGKSIFRTILLIKCKI